MYQISNEYLKVRMKKVRKTENSRYFVSNLVKDKWNKKVQKTENSWYFLSPRAITLWKINGSKPKSNFICILVCESNVSNIKWISESTKKVRKTENSWYFQNSKGHNSVKNWWIKTRLELDLYLSMAKQCTKYQMNIWKREQKKCGKLIYWTDGQTECKPKVPSDFVGRGLKRDIIIWNFVP
jgi:hypothetical protein